jgi:predicted restriction endonuclease
VFPAAFFVCFSAMNVSYHTPGKCKMASLSWSGTFTQMAAISYKNVGNHKYNLISLHAKNIKLIQVLSISFKWIRSNEKAYLAGCEGLVPAGPLARIPG